MLEHCAYCDDPRRGGSPRAERPRDSSHNGKSMPPNSPHVVPKDYTFHGTMRPASPNSDIEYQDGYNAGSGGTGSIILVGKVHTLRD
ncbi:hypothetical protein VTK26DRAFT_4628 [Humicola hyalothermophila]